MELRAYQREAVASLRHAGRAIFAYPPGVGKTLMTATWLKDEGAGCPLIVVPKPVIPHWETTLAIAGQAAVVTNYEQFRTGRFSDSSWDAVIFDESHRLKNRQSLTFKEAKLLTPKVGTLGLVTGTPIINRADELWTSLHMLDHTRYRAFWRWAEYHFQIKTPRYRGRLVREVGDLLPGHARLLRQEMGERYIYRSRKELLPELPPVIETYIEVELSRAERKAYDSMLEKTWMVVGDGVVVAENIVAQQTRLRQLASDWTVFGEPNLGSKAKAAVELANDLEPDQVLIFVAFQNTANAIADKLESAGVYHGGISERMRSQTLESFRQGNTRVLVATIASIGEAVDGLQVAHEAIFVDRDWAPKRNDQAISRLDRLGQLRAVNVRHIVAKNTIDDAVANALRRKRSVIEAVLHHSNKAA